MKMTHKRQMFLWILLKKLHKIKLKYNSLSLMAGTGNSQNGEDLFPGLREAHALYDGLQEFMLSPAQQRLMANSQTVPLERLNSTSHCSAPSSPRMSNGEKNNCQATSQQFLASLIVHLVKNPPAMQETPVRLLGREDLLEKGQATHSSILAWRIPRAVESMGCKESDMTE